MGANTFRVIVVGGGPVGLTAAHALNRAGIDFLVLERRPEVVIDAGSNLVLMPIGLRALSQLGLLDGLHTVSSPLGRIDRLDHDGHNIGDAQWFVQMKINFGFSPRVISRHDLTETLYDKLPPDAQAKILTNKTLSDIAVDGAHTVVTCEDGSSYRGSLILGADGAHSMVRQLMLQLAIDNSAAVAGAETPFLTTYRALWICSPRTTDILPGTTCETHGRNAATQFFAGEDSTVIGVYERLEKPTKKRMRYTMADQDAFVKRWGFLPVTPSGKLTLHELYASRLEAGLVSLEEGVVEHWSWAGRIVLAGDAAHKFTPSTGAGCNSGIIDVVALVNELRSLVGSKVSAIDRKSAAPTSMDLASALQAYQAVRFKTVLGECEGASRATALATWQSRTYKLIDCRLLSIQTLQRTLINLGAQTVARTPKFDFVELGELSAGKTPWALRTPRTSIVMA